jgi:hypothetical protein
LAMHWMQTPMSVRGWPGCRQRRRGHRRTGQYGARHSMRLAGSQPFQAEPWAAQMGRHASVGSGRRSRGSSCAKAAAGVSGARDGAYLRGRGRRGASRGWDGGWGCLLRGERLRGKRKIAGNGWGSSTIQM